MNQLAIEEAMCERLLVSARVLSIAPRAHANSQSKRHVPPAPIRTPEHSSRLGGQKRILFACQNTNAASLYRAGGCIFPYTIYLRINLSLAVVPLYFGNEDGLS